MRAVLADLAAMMSFEAIFFIALPRTVKRLIDLLSPSELRIVGAIELLIAGAVVYYLVVGA